MTFPRAVPVATFGDILTCSGAPPLLGACCGSNLGDIAELQMLAPAAFSHSCKIASAHRSRSAPNAWTTQAAVMSLWVGPPRLARVGTAAMGAASLGL